MAIVRKYLVNDNYTKMDNQVARDTDISDYSYRLYGFVAAFKNGFQLNDEYIAKSLSWSRDKVARAKKNLKDKGYILIQKIDRQTYFLYIGNSKVSAAQVKENWEAIERGDWD